MEREIIKSNYDIAILVSLMVEKAVRDIYNVLKNQKNTYKWKYSFNNMVHELNHSNYFLNSEWFRMLTKDKIDPSYIYDTIKSIIDHKGQLRHIERFCDMLRNDIFTIYNLN